MVSDEKDRLGDKLREAERGREDQYFAARDRRLVEQMRRRQPEHEEDVVRGVAPIHCPKCGHDLQHTLLHGVAVDECPSCNGVWLDKSELDEIGRREDNGWIARWLRREFEKPK